MYIYRYVYVCMCVWCMCLYYATPAFFLLPAYGQLIEPKSRGMINCTATLTRLEHKLKFYYFCIARIKRFVTIYIVYVVTHTQCMRNIYKRVSLCASQYKFVFWVITIVYLSFVLLRLLSHPKTRRQEHQ